MRPLLLDADAFRCLHGLELLEPVLSALSAKTSIVLTEYVARHELSLLSTLVDALEKRAVVQIVRVLKGTAAGLRFREFRKIVDKGEAEAIAWALDAPADRRALFITRDDGASRFAASHGVPVTDVMGLVIEACVEGGFDRDAAASALLVWDDPEQHLCKPRGYRGFEVEAADRQRRRGTWS